MIEFVPPAASRVLDVGCSSGRFGRVLRERGHPAHLTGIEPDPLTASEAAEYYDQVIRGLYPEDMPDETFDCIVMNDVLEHIEDQ
jgi:2-polyprenyl-3-methyl-5-hydroxy-6-metoxy-1,4-benzoquinol methylase